jgi:homoserine acetyltransferase
MVRLPRRQTHTLDNFAVYYQNRGKHYMAGNAAVIICHQGKVVSTCLAQLVRQPGFRVSF